MTDKITRVGPKWTQFEDTLRKNIGPVPRRRIKEDVASFIEKEGLLEVMVRRAKKKRRGGLFD